MTFNNSFIQKYLLGVYNVPGIVLSKAYVYKLTTNDTHGLDGEERCQISFQR